MIIKITILGDTHLNSFEELPKEILNEIKKSDWVIHVGDYTSGQVLSSLIKLKGDRFKGVYGNADPLEVRNKLKSKEIIDISGKKIGITHPASGGPEDGLEAKVIAGFEEEDLDVLIYGHTHESKIIRKNNFLLINPGKGYVETNFFGPPTTYITLTIKDDKIQGMIKEIKT
ncbi:MAG: metallophosphoesterase family protein [Promethearchaeota archaeon]|jgi:putative phosphoesterase